MLAVVTAMVILAGCGFSDTEQKYLNVMHNPCQYPDIVQDATVCDFVWDGNEKAQVSEGHEICDIEKRVPPEEIYEAPSASSGTATARWRHRWVSRGISRWPRRCHNGGRTGGRPPRLEIDHI
jgi:hypothetical protein